MSRGFIPLLAFVLAIGLGALAAATCGFRAVTSGGARDLAVERAPLPLPEIRLIDQDGDRFSLGDYRGKTLLVEFIYTRCPTLCGVLGDDFRHVLALLGQPAFHRKYALLSISFDPAHDDRAALQLYGERYGASAPGWRIAVPADASGLRALLRAFGVVVVPDGAGGFVHSGAVFVVNQDTRLSRILDPDAPPPVIAAALAGAS